MIRTLIAEDVPLVRGGLVALLSREIDIELVADLDRHEHVAPIALSLRPDVVVISADLDGFSTAHHLTMRLPSCATLILAVRASTSELRRAVSAGALGYVVKDAPPGQLANAIRRISRGKKVIDPDLAFAALTADDNPLTIRELDVLRLAAGGAPAREIAGELCLSVGTVRNHLSRVITKTGARNSVDAIRIAGESGWL